MGNCLRRDSSMQWGGDDWGSNSPESINTRSHDDGDDYVEKQDQKELFLHQQCSKSSSNVKEVKIKISKKELAELLGRVDMNELSVEQVLAQLINITNAVVSDRNRPWKPDLQSIPE
ncbi:hypothetical protein M5689_014312 [Euphorbia peplus]|nr:hypothetical protein M5689_014312 [Euphorbia peplus]